MYRVHLSSGRVTQKRHLKMFVEWMKVSPIFLPVEGRQTDTAIYTLYIYIAFCVKSDITCKYDSPGGYSHLLTCCHLCLLVFLLDPHCHNPKSLLSSVMGTVHSQVYPTWNLISECSSSSACPSKSAILSHHHTIFCILTATGLDSDSYYVSSGWVITNSFPVFLPPLFTLFWFYSAPIIYINIPSRLIQLSFQIFTMLKISANKFFMCLQLLFSTYLFIHLKPSCQNPA